HGLDGVAVQGGEERLDRPVGGVPFVLEGERRERHELLQLRSQRQRQVGHSLIVAGAARRPRPDLAGAEGRLAGFGQPALEELEVHRLQSSQHVRLAKYLAHAGAASRRAAEELVRAGRVTVGGEVVRDPARDVDDGSAVALDGVAVAGPEPRAVYAVHKPEGVVSTARDPGERATVVDLLPDEGRRLYPVGRLDADTTGLLLLTNDGELAHRLTHPS